MGKFQTCETMTKPDDDENSVPVNIRTLPDDVFQTFAIRYNERTQHWQYRYPQTDNWSQPLRYSALMAAIGREIASRYSVKVASEEDKGWNRPLPHMVKRPVSQKQKLDQLMDRYEIRGGKVERIAFDAAERQKQQVDMLLGLFTDDAEGEARSVDGDDETEDDGAPLAADELIKKVFGI